MKSLIKEVAARLYHFGVRAGRVPPGVRILMYHSVGESIPHDDYGLSVPLRAFADQVRFVKERFPVVAASRQGLSAANASDVSVAFTFDDGFVDNLQAGEVLSKAGMPFTIYVTADKVGAPHFLSKEQLRSLAANPLCQIGAHGLTHQKLGHLSEAEQRRELQESKAILEDITCQPIQTMSYPHGSLSPLTQKLAQDAGYQLSTSCRPGVNSAPIGDWFHLCRTEIRDTDDLGRFERKITGYYDYMASTYALRSRFGYANEFVRAPAKS